MKKTIVAIILFMNVWSIFCQNHHPTGFFTGNHPTGFFIGDSIPVFANSYNDKIQEMYDNTNSDIFFQTHIIRAKNNCFYVSIEPINDTTRHILHGWAQVGSIGVGLYNRQREEIPLYEKPTYISNINIVKVQVESVIATVKHCKGKWLEIEFNIGDQRIRGWLAPENQCADLYTMCCGW
jgi:hypothetical protein